MEILREEEEQKIRAIYNDHIRQINDNSSFWKPRDDKVVKDAALWILFFIFLIIFWPLAILIVGLYYSSTEKASTDQKKSLVECGFNRDEVNREQWSHPQCLGD